MQKTRLLLIGGLLIFLTHGIAFASPKTDTAVKNLQNCLGDCVKASGVSLNRIAACGKKCEEFAFKDAIEHLDRCEDLLVPVVASAVEKAAEKAGCKGIVWAFETACSTVTAMEGAPVCTVGSAVIGFNCGLHDEQYAKRNAQNIARDVCDYVFPDSDPYILIENHLEQEDHEVDFKAVVDKGDDVHIRGGNWLAAGDSGILASHKLKGGDFNGVVKARIKRKLKKDVELTIDHVKPNRDNVYVYHKDGSYHIDKNKRHINPQIAIFNDLENHKVDFRVAIIGSNDVHLPGDNWLKPGGKAILGSYKLYGESYTVKARIKRDGKGDITLTERGVHPGKHKVRVYHKDDKYQITKENI